MRKGRHSSLYGLAVCAVSCATGVAAQQARPAPRAIPLICAGQYRPLLMGVRQTAGMRSGFVRLTPGTTAGRHTTGNHEETLVIFRGRGTASLDTDG